MTVVSIHARLLSPALAATLLVASPAQAQLKDAPVSDIFESYNDCFAATAGGEVSVAALEDLEWELGDWEEGDDDMPLVFSHPERAPIIMLTADEGDGLCVVIARTENEKTYETFVGAFGGKLPAPDANGVIYYTVKGHIVRLAQTGTAEEPGMTLAVGTLAEN